MNLHVYFYKLIGKIIISSGKKNPSNLNYRRAITGSLRNKLAVTGATKTPAVIHTLQPTPLINPSFRKWSQSMRTTIVKHLPFILVLIPPHHNIQTHHLLPTWSPLVQITHRHEWIPVRKPVKFIILIKASRFGFLFRLGCWLG
ncbi:hypothetical protein Hanom_Chr14g01268681 [Helianthus anomalus]